MDKRGISAIVATVLIILITVAAVTIIWVAIIPMIKDKIDFNQESVSLQIITLEGYTVYDSNTKLVTVQVEQGPEDVDLKGISFSFLYNGSSLALIKYEVPGPNKKLVYRFNSSRFGKPISVSVAPIFSDGSVGEISSTKEFVEGVLVDNGEGWDVIGDTSYEEEPEEPAPCVYSSWVNQGCGLGGSCGLGEMYQVRELVSGNDCSDLLEQCDNTDATCSLLSGAVSWWKFDDAPGSNIAIDSGFGGNDGTLFGGAEIIDGELKLVASSSNPSRMEVDDNSLNNAKLTVSAWVKLSPGSISWACLIAREFGFWLGLSAGTTILRGDANYVGRSAITSPDEMTLDEWHHIVMTYDGSQNKIYIDKIEKKSDDGSGDITGWEFPLTIGGNVYGPTNQSINGSMDDIMIYDRALSESEINEINDYQKAIKEGGGALLPPQTGVGIDGMVKFDELPYLKNNVQVLQYSSFGRDGLNWDDGFNGKYSYLYMDGTDYVIFDEIGAGAIYNLWMTGTSLNDSGRLLFYFDNEPVPRIDMTIGDFFNGAIGAPFTSPLTGKIAYTRYSFVPILFSKRLKIVMTEQPYFYHAIYHKYDDSINIDTYTGNEDYSALMNMWDNKGSHPTGDEGSLIGSDSGININAGQTSTLVDYSEEDYNYISSIKIDPSSLDDIWIKIYWDGESVSRVNAPLGEFFGSGLGEYDIESLPIGMSTTEDYYCYFPMPFTSRAKIEIENKGSSSISLDYEIRAKEDSNMIAGYNAGYFHAYYNKEFPTQENIDYKFLETTGRGHFVGVIQTLRGLANSTDEINSAFRRRFLEGDERFFVDDKLSPSMHGTGTEDYYLGAYYFAGLPYYEGMFGVNFKITTPDGRYEYTPYRFQIWDFVTFESKVKLGVEHGGLNEGPATEVSMKRYNGNYSSVAFYYAIDEPGIELSDEEDIITGTSETYKYPGYDNDIPLSIADEGGTTTAEFIANINQNNRGVILRRRLDYSLANQLGDVYVDDEYVGKWYTAGSHDVYNPANDIKWLDSDFHIPASFTNGKSSITIRIESGNWNEYYYWVYSKI